MHRVLERQIKRFLGEIDPNNTPPNWLALLVAVSEAYAHSDQDRELSLRSLELSSAEFVEINKKLRSQNEIIEQKVKERTEELEREKVKLDEVAENMDMGAILLDKIGEVIFVNRAGAEIIGSAKPAEIIEKFSTNFNSVSAREHLAQCLEGISSVVPEAEYKDKIFKILFRNLSSGGSTVGHLIWIEDITESKLLERAKSEFVAIASHEMRTPLSIIRGQAELLLGLPFVISSPEEISKRITSIKNSSIRLLGIVDDFLDLTQLEEKRIIFKKEEFDVAPVIQDVVFDFQKMASQKGLSLSFVNPSSQLPKVLADKERVEQVATNIVGNAIQYTETGGVTVSAIAEPNYVKVFVKDTGVGIDLARQALLFQKFQAAGKAFMHSKEYGSGMGLYIGKILVESMGGGIKLEESAVGKGSTLSFTIPLAAPKGYMVQ